MSDSDGHTRKNNRATAPKADRAQTRRQPPFINSRRTAEHAKQSTENSNQQQQKAMPDGVAFSVRKTRTTARAEMDAQT